MQKIRSRKEVFNFSAGPAVLPTSVLEKVQAEILSYGGSGMSVMELSHRSSWFIEIIESAEVLLRELMAIPDNYKVLFLQGGASLQFAMVPLNIAPNKKIGFIDTGVWSAKAIEEAQKLGGYDVRVLATGKESNFSKLPQIGEIPTDLDYLHITTNNTIEGTCFFDVPKTDVTLVADMSSNILANAYDVRDFGVIYAGAQKNLGPAGVCVVIIREDLLELNTNPLPTMLDFKIQAKNKSLYNTPPTFAIYVMKLVFEWSKQVGGVAAIEKNNRTKAGILYDYLDASTLFSSPVDKSCRSLTNIPFITGDKTIDSDFIKQATAAGFENLTGHRLVGGMRASLYNAFPIEGVYALVDFMKKFAEARGEK
ncbi:3-phosphoserine/phosphohydroxythreonine aminotransferase [Erysipelotrichaceae bacterium]|nr:3-phosphoserine/phosphohydroxythreonine aminotransferase [Erysipelotrichaceae bacterium]